MKPYHTPIRMCVVCRQTSAKKTLLRVVRRPEKEGGGLAADSTFRANGRGAYVCASQECIEKAIKQKRFERALNVLAAPPELADALMAHCAAAPPTELSSGAAAL